LANGTEFKSGGFFTSQFGWGASIRNLEHSDIFWGIVTGILALAALLVIFGF
jgi:hypothetical protein